MDKTASKFKTAELFVHPPEYVEAIRVYGEEMEKWEAQMDALVVDMDTLETRIMPASPEKLQNIIGDIDNLGEVRLIDTQLRSTVLPSGSSTKALGSGVENK